MSFPKLVCSSLVGNIYILGRDVMEPYGHLSSPLFLCPTPPHVERPSKFSGSLWTHEGELDHISSRTNGRTNSGEHHTSEERDPPLWKVPLSCLVSLCRRGRPWEKPIALTPHAHPRSVVRSVCKSFKPTIAFTVCRLIFQCADLL